MSFSESLDHLVTENRNGLLSKHPSWERVELRSIAKVLNGFPFPSSNFSRESGKPLLRIRDILDQSTETRYVGDFDPLYLVQPGDLLIGMDGDFNSALWNGTEALLNQRVCKLKIGESFYNKKLLSYALPGYLKAINDATSSITVKHLSSRTIEEIPLPLPPRLEQDRIVAEIEKQFTRLDDAVTALKRVQANLKRYRASVLKAACEGRLVPTEAELARKEGRCYEPASELLKRILVERRAKWESDQLQKMIAAGKPPKNDEWKGAYSEPSTVDTTNLPSLAEGWTWVRAEQVCEFITKGTTPSAQKLHENNGEVPYIKVYNLTHHGTLDFSRNPTFIDRATHTDELARSRVYPSDVLMNIVGPPLGKVSIVPNTHQEWNINQAIAIFRPLRGLSNLFLANLLLSEGILSWATRRAKATAGQFNLTLELCRDLPLPLAPELEQERINGELARRFSSTDALHATFDVNLRRASSLRQAVLMSAFSGKLVPQDPRDEPASVLLERIRAERAARATNSGNQKATSQAGTKNGQRRRRVKKLAHL